jgi:histidine triad (HIT) family protein
MNECVFCSIVNGVSPASVVYSDEKVLAFLDIQPVNAGHTLVIPKAHVVHLSALDENTGASMFKVAMHIAEALRNSDLNCEGINLHLADGEVAGQEILHTHLHVIPRFIGDGFSVRFRSSYGVRPERKELDAIAKIQNSFEKGIVWITTCVCLQTDISDILIVIQLSISRVVECEEAHSYFPNLVLNLFLLRYDRLLLKRLQQS